MFAKENGLTLKEWLESLSKVTNVIPCKITIGKTTFEACQYRQKFRTVFYVIGALPSSYRHSSHIKYMLDNQVYYVAAYYQIPNPLFDQYHYDINFLLMLWDSTLPIDYGYTVPYKSMRMIVTYENESSYRLGSIESVLSGIPKDKSLAEWESE